MADLITSVESMRVCSEFEYRWAVEWMVIVYYEELGLIQCYTFDARRNVPSVYIYFGRASFAPVYSFHSKNVL